MPRRALKPDAAPRANRDSGAAAEWFWLARTVERERLSSRELLVIGLMLTGHPQAEQSFTQAVYRYLRGEGPAAVALGYPRERPTGWLGELRTAARLQVVEQAASA